VEVLRKAERDRGLVEVAEAGPDLPYRLWGGPFPEGVKAGYTTAALAGDVASDMRCVAEGVGGAAGIASMKQVHGRDVRTVDAPGVYRCDGIFSRLRSLALVVRTADCLPLVFHSARESVSGVVHMGWRSAEAGILENTGYDLSRFSCVAGPGLRRCCYSVGEDFAARARIGAFVRKSGGSYFFDPIAFVASELERLGLPRGAFFDAGICSHCSGPGLHSHRRTLTPHRTLSFIIDQGGDEDA
jgi:copper oxidase (laccase) domain-containing protein